MLTRWVWAALGLEAAFVGMRCLGDLRQHAAAFLILFGLACWCFWLVAYPALRHPHLLGLSTRQAWWVIGGVGLVFRLTLLPLTPTLSDDIYRYLWDGRVQLAGLNPYQYAPNDAALASLRTPESLRINHPDIPSIYPPLTQLVFRLGAALRPTLLMQKALFVACDLLLLALLLLALPRWGRPPACAVLYAWHPLVVVEVAGSGHNDALGILWLMLGCWLWTWTRPAARYAAAAAWGACALSKWASILLVPWLLLRRGYRRYALCLLAVVALGYAPWWTEVFNWLGRSGSHYASAWEFNSLGYALLVQLVSQPSIARTILLCGLGVWSVLMARRCDAPVTYLLATLGAVVLVAPVVEPWYLLWLVPLLCVRPRAPWLIFTLLVALSYAVLIGYVRDGSWQVPLWVKWVEYGAVIMMLIWEWRSRRGGSGLGVRNDAVAPPSVRGAARVSGSLVPHPDKSIRMRLDHLGVGHHARSPSDTRCSPEPLAAGGSPHVSVIIPALNEEQGVREVLREIPREVIREVIVVDNGSTDATAQAARDGGARVVAEPRRGYGQACLAGLEALSSSTEIIVFLDADHSDYPEEMPQLIAPIARGEADLVIGSRVLGGAPSGSLTPQQRWGNWLACHLMALRWGHRYTDLGPFRAVRRSALERLAMTDRAFGWTVEMQIKALQHRLRVVEVPVRYRPRIGRSKISGTLRGTLFAGTTILSVIARSSFQAAAFRNPQPKSREPVAAKKSSAAPTTTS